MCAKSGKSTIQSKLPQASPSEIPVPPACSSAKLACIPAESFSIPPRSYVPLMRQLGGRDADAAAEARNFDVDAAMKKRPQETQPMNELPPHFAAGGEQGGNNLKGFKNFHPENGSSEGQNLVVTDLFVPNFDLRSRDFDICDQARQVLARKSRTLRLCPGGKSATAERMAVVPSRSDKALGMPPDESRGPSELFDRLI